MIAIKCAAKACIILKKKSFSCIEKTKVEHATAFIDQRQTGKS